MKKKTPKVSVLMPCYNEEHRISEAIESILNQTFHDFELIIVDDGSTDGSWDLISKYSKMDDRIVVIRNDEQCRICKTLNRGIKVVKAEYIVRMDADDWSYPYRLKEQYNYMRKNPDVVVSGGSIEVCDEKLKVLNLREYNLTDEAIRAKLFLYSPFSHPSTILCTRVIKKVGGYNTFLSVAQDYELYFKMGLHGQFGNLDNVLLKLRTHQRSTSQVMAKRQQKLTLYIRVKAVMEYGYRVNLRDKLFFFCQLISTSLIPGKFMFFLFNFIRKFI